MSQQTYPRISLILQALRTVAIVLIVPAITYMGYWINNTIQERALAKEYVELAISVLREPELGSNEKQALALRTWAVKVLQDSSPVELPDDLKMSFHSGSVVLPHPQTLAPEIHPYRDTEDDAHCDVHLRYGRPSNDHALCRLGFALSHDHRMGVPRWVGYRLLPDRQRVVDQRFPFMPDPALPDGGAILDAFRGSGFDRGHLVPSFEMAWSYSAAREVQFHSNLSPQHPSLNRGGWAALDRAIHGWVDKRGVLYVVTGPVFKPGNSRRLNDAVAVPVAYFKVVYDPAERAVLAFLLPNDESVRSYADLTRFLVTVDEVERRTGLDVFSDLPEQLQTTLEADRGVIWKLYP